MPQPLNTVEVIFANSDYNYTTSVSALTNEKTAREYFVNRFFCVSSFPYEKLERCVNIIFHNNSTNQF